MSAAPHKYGIGIFSPALDKDGNSVAGLDLLRDIVEGLELDIFDQLKIGQKKAKLLAIFCGMLSFFIYKLISNN